MEDLLIFKVAKSGVKSHANTDNEVIDTKLEDLKPYGEKEGFKRVCPKCNGLVILQGNGTAVLHEDRQGISSCIWCGQKYRLTDIRKGKYESEGKNSKTGSEEIH